MHADTLDCANTVLWEQWKLDFLQTAKNKGKAVIYVFHGTTDPCVKNYIWPFLQRHRDENAGVWAAFLGSKNDAVDSVDEVCRWLQPMKIRIVLVPMLLQQGYCYERLAEIGQKYGVAVGECLNRAQIIAALLQAARSDTAADAYRIVMLHASQDNYLYRALKQDCEPYNMHVCRNLEDVMALNLPRNVTLSACYMLMGNHVRYEIFGQDNSIFSFLRKCGCHITRDSRTLIEFL